jgi:hypothetical protein
MHQLKDNRPSIKSAVTILLGFPRHVLFFRLPNCVQGGFFNFPKMSGLPAFVESLWWTRVLLIFKPTWNARRRRKLLEVKWVQQCNKFFLLYQETNQMMLYYHQRVRFHFIPWNIIVVTIEWTAFLFYSK